MKRPLAAALALALALMPVSAQPARAQETDQLLGLLVGIGALYAIGRALSDHGERAPAALPPRTVAPEPVRPVGERAWPHGRKGYPDHRERFAKVVPADCFRRVETRHGTVRGFPRYCVERTMRHADRLPAQCLTRVRTERGPRDVYRAGCLRSEGWRMDDRPGARAGW
jgi:hypothetical protein